MRMTVWTRRHRPGRRLDALKELRSRRISGPDPAFLHVGTGESCCFIIGSQHKFYWRGKCRTHLYSGCPSYRQLSTIFDMASEMIRDLIIYTTTRGILSSSAAFSRATRGPAFSFPRKSSSGCRDIVPRGFTRYAGHRLLYNTTQHSTCKDRSYTRSTPLAWDAAQPDYRQYCALRRISHELTYSYTFRHKDLNALQVQHRPNRKGHDQRSPHAGVVTFRFPALGSLLAIYACAAALSTVNQSRCILVPRRTVPITGLRRKMIVPCRRLTWSHLGSFLTLPRNRVPRWSARRRVHRGGNRSAVMKSINHSPIIAASAEILPKK